MGTVNVATAAHAPMELEAHRAFLRSVAFRLTGTVADADDVVQEAFVRALVHPPADRSRPLRPWLVRVTVNVARDLLRRRRRRGYIGPWLPGVVDIDALDGSDDEVAFVDGADIRYGRRESATFAFLLALEALTPLQRAVLVLREVFDFSGRETAEALGISDDNAKTVLSRAKKALQNYDAARVVPGAARGERDAAALQRFMLALVEDDVDGALAALRDDVIAVSDGGGVYAAGLKPWVGRDKVVEVWRKLLRLWPPGSFDVEAVTLNAQPAIVMRVHAPKKNLAPVWVFRADTDDDGRIVSLFTVAAPDKLRGLSTPD